MEQFLEELGALLEKYGTHIKADDVDNIGIWIPEKEGWLFFSELSPETIRDELFTLRKNELIKTINENPETLDKVLTWLATSVGNH